MAVFYFYPFIASIFATSTTFLLFPPRSFVFDTKIKDCEVNVGL